METRSSVIEFLKSSSFNGRSPTPFSLLFLINLLHHWTFSLKAYCYHKSVFVHLNIESARDFPKWDLIASIQLSRLIWNLYRRVDTMAIQMNPLPSQMNCPRCNQRSKLSDRRYGNCGAKNRETRIKKKNLNRTFAKADDACLTWMQSDANVNRINSIL